MAELLVTPDVELAAVTFLRSGLGSLADKVATKVPSTMPNRMVRVSLTGGSRLNVAADTAQLTVECWGADEPSTSNLARRAQALMFSAAGETAGGLFVRKVESVGGVQFFPDPDTAKPRYQFTVRWHVRPATI
jgi:hypothetical protein